MSKLPEVLFKKTIWDQEKNPYWLSSTIHLYRNFSLYKFPGKMSAAEMTGCVKNIAETLHNIPSFQPLSFFPAEELTPLDKELLFEYFQCTQGFQEARQGQGFALNTEGSCLITLNQGSHIQLHLATADTDLVAAWTSLCQIDDSVGRAHPYAFSPRFGYLTSNPLLCGTALEARLFLHVPALRHTGALQEVLNKCSDEHILFLSLEGSMADLVGDFLILKNRYTLGISEETLLSLLQNTALKISAAEKKKRDELRATPSADLKDFVGRSFGLLTHSYQLHPKEALDSLSGLKLGTDLGWVTGITSQKLSTLMLQLRRGHLSLLLNLTSSDPQELSHKRAQWLHEQIKGISISEP
jgi:protein arginine kinase